MIFLSNNALRRWSYLVQRYKCHSQDLRKVVVCFSHLPSATASIGTSARTEEVCGIEEQVRGRLTVQSLEGTHRYRGIMHAASVIMREVRVPCRK